MKKKSVLGHSSCIRCPSYRIFMVYFFPRYNNILQNGLPDWRQPVFYYRRVRKMGVAELGALLCIIITIGHYFVMWAVYLERRLALVNNLKHYYTTCLRCLVRPLCVSIIFISALDRMGNRDNLRLISHIFS